MPRTATATRATVVEREADTANQEAEGLNRDGDDDDVAVAKISPFMRRLQPSMIYEPGPLDFVDMDSTDFVSEMINRRIIRPIQFKTREDWLKVAEDAWDWYESEEFRRKQAIVRKFFASIADDEIALALVKEEAATIDVEAVAVAA